MRPLDITFDMPNWEQILQTVPAGSSYPAGSFLALMESESEHAFADALQILKNRQIALDVSALPQEFGQGDSGARLRREYQLVSNGQLFENLEDTDPLKMYLDEIRSGETDADVSHLVRQMCSGDSSVVPTLVSALLPEIVEYACTFVGRGVMLPDLIQEGSLALWESLSEYSGGDFSAFVKQVVVSAMSCCVVQQARSAGVGEQLRRKAQSYQEMDGKLLTQLGRNPTKEEIAQALGISPEEADFIEDMLSSARMLASLSPKQEQAPEEEDQSVEDTAYFHMRQRVQELLSELTKEQAALLSLRFGLDGTPPMTPEQVAKRLHMTPEEVILAEADALAQLRKL